MKTKRWKSLRTAASIFCAALMLFSCIGIYAPDVAKADTTTKYGQIILVNDPSETHVSIVETDSSGNITGQTYTAYKIFTLTQDSSHTSAFDYEVNSKLAGFFTDKKYNDANGKEQTVDSTSNNSIRKYMEATLYGYNTSGAVNTTASATAVEAFANEMKTYIKGTTNLGLVENTDYYTSTASDKNSVTYEGKTYTESVTFGDGTSSMALGYYLILGSSKPNDTDKDTVVTSCILDTTTWDASSGSSGAYTVTIKIKAGIPTCDKKIKTVDGVYSSTDTDASDTTTKSNYITEDAATAEIGDIVTFEIDSCLPSLTGYTDYTFKVTDTFCDGLDLVYETTDASGDTINSKVTDATTAVQAIKVEVYNSNLAEDNKWQEVTTTPNNDNTTTKNWTCTFTARSAASGTTPATRATLTITPANGYTYLKTLVDTYGAGTKIRFTYSARLNGSATIGAAGNENTATVTYSNDPSTASTSANDNTNDTPESTVKVYTFALDLYKYTGADAASGTALSGAEFELYDASQVDSNGDLNTSATPITFASSGTSDGKTPYSAQVSSSTTTLVSSSTSGSEGKIVINGLKEGTYYLKETKAPAGYNLIEGLTKVTFTPTYDTTDKTKLTNLTGTVGSATASLIYTTSTKGTYDTTKGENQVIAGIHSDIVNNTGSELPSTGGAGRTMICLIGGLLIAIAVISMTVRKLARKDR